MLPPRRRLQPRVGAVAAVGIDPTGGRLPRGALRLRRVGRQVRLLVRERTVGRHPQRAALRDGGELLLSECLRRIDRRRAVGVPEDVHLLPRPREDSIDRLAHAGGRDHRRPGRGALEPEVQETHGISFLLNEVRAHEHVAARHEILTDLRERDRLVLGAVPSEHRDSRVRLPRACRIGATSAVAVASNFLRLQRVPLGDLLVTLQRSLVDHESARDELLDVPRVEPGLHDDEAVGNGGRGLGVAGH